MQSITVSPTSCGINDQAIKLSREAARVGANLLSVALHNALCRGAHHEAPTFLKASNGLLRQHEARFLMGLFRPQLSSWCGGRSPAVTLPRALLFGTFCPVLQAERRPALGMITTMLCPARSVAHTWAGHAAAAGPIAHRGIAAALKGRTINESWRVRSVLSQDGNEGVSDERTSVSNWPHLLQS